MVKIQDVALIEVKPLPQPGEPTKCGYCMTGNCEYCPKATRSMASPPRIWPCSCETCGGGSQLRCLDCKNTWPGEVNPATWSCLDPDACKNRSAARLAANPAVQHLNKLKENSSMATKTAPAKKAPAPRKAGVCLVTGEPTSGGLFKPGMDARYVSERVADVTSKRVTVIETRKRLKADGVSEALIAKFEKSLGLARERLTQKATEKAAAPAAAKKAAAPVQTAAQRRAAAKAEKARLEAEAAEVEDDEEEDEEVEDEDGF